MTEVLMLDPKKLKSHTLQLRGEMKDLDDLVESIKANGIIEPIVIVNGDTIVAGHRRAAAAVKAKLATVPCIEREPAEGMEQRSELDVVSAMMAENVVRRNLTAADEAKGYAQLSMMGVAIGDIAKEHGRKPEEIEAAIHLTEKPKAHAVAAKYDLTLEHAVALAEFEEDKHELMELTTCAVQDPSRFEHTLERVRENKIRRQAVEKATADAKDHGEKILDAAPHSNAKAKPIDHLLDAEGKKLTPGRHRKCPGHAVVITAPYWGEKRAQVAVWCLDFAANGHKVPKGASPSHQAPTKVSPEEKARREAEAARKAEFASATTVRREFITKLVARKLNAVETAVLWQTVALTIVDRDGRARPTSKSEVELFCDLVGNTEIPEDTWAWDGPAKAIEGARATALPSVMVALLASTTEPHIEPGYFDEMEIRWYDLLCQCGYSPADLEATELEAARTAAEQEDDD